MTTQQIAQAEVRSITSQGPGGSGVFCLEVAMPGSNPEFLHGWQPGQFVMVREPRNQSCLTWARPFCISHTDGDVLTLYFQEAGRATREMAKLQPGAPLDIWGPLGNSLAVEEDTPTLLLAGGMGIAPLVGYTARHPRPENLTLEFAHRLPLECYPFKKFSHIQAASHPESCLDDRECYLALVDKSIAALRPSGKDGAGLVLACGPHPFLKYVQQVAIKHNVRAQISLETRMACGIGACLGCVVKASQEPDKARTYTQTCTSGPNFWVDRVDI